MVSRAVDRLSRAWKRGRTEARDALTKEVGQRYEGDVIRVYFTDFVMQ